MQIANDNWKKCMLNFSKSWRLDENPYVMEILLSQSDFEFKPLLQWTLIHKLFPLGLDNVWEYSLTISY